MKFKNQTSESIVLINEQTAIKLKEITNSTVVYSIDFDVDLNEAAQKNNAFAGKIYFSKLARQPTAPILSKDRNGVDSPEISPIPRIRNTDGTENTSVNSRNLIGNQLLINEIRAQSTTRKETVKRNDQNILKTLNFSLYDFASRDDIERARTNNYVREERVVAPISVRDSNGTPILEQRPSNITPNPISTQTATQFLRAALNQNQDPTSLVLRTNGINSSVRSAGGIATPTPPLNLLQQSIANPATLTPQAPLSPTSFVSQIRTQTSTKVKVSLEFSIEKDYFQGANTVYFEIELNDESNRPVYTKLLSTNHAKNLDFILIPRFAPRISSFYRRGSDQKLVLFLRQIDPKAAFILLYFKEIDNEDYSQPYSFLGKIQLKISDGEKKLEINRTLNKKTLIRAFAASEEERKGLLFDSILVPETKISTTETPLTTQPVVLWDYRLNSDNTISVNGTIQYQDAVSVKITRKTNRSETENDVYGPYFLNGSTQFSFKDTDVTSDNTYVYNAYIISRDGILRKSLQDLIVQNVKIGNNIISTQITSATNNSNGNMLNVQFTLSSNLTRTNAAFVLENFKAQGIYDLYKDIFTVSDTDLSFAYKVIRKNLTTGLEEDFGILQNNNFDDKFLRTNKNVKPLEAGNVYKYYIYSFLRRSDSLLPSLVVSESYRNQTYTYQPFYSRNPFVLKHGTQITELSLKEQHVQSQYSFGPTGEVLEYDADFSKILPSVTNVLATNLTRTENLLQWKVEGNLDKIDHFIIVLQQLTNRAIVGKVHNISETNSFDFYDTLTDGESGEIEYVIIPVYFDYIFGQEVKSNTIIV
jgi:hypothetical protein